MISIKRESLARTRQKCGPEVGIPVDRNAGAYSSSQEENSMAVECPREDKEKFVCFL